MHGTTNLKLKKCSSRTSGTGDVRLLLSTTYGQTACLSSSCLETAPGSRAKFAVCQSYFSK